MCCHLRIVLVVTSVLWLCATTNINAQQSENLLDTPIERFSVVNLDITTSLSKLSAVSKIPIGLEIKFIGANAKSPKLNIEIESSTLGEILARIVIQDPDYEWKINDGVVNVRPRTSKDDILDTLISTFSFRNGTVYELRTALTKIPEIEKKAKKSNLSFITIALTSAEFKLVNKDFAIELKDVPLQHLLNRIISNAAFNFWVVSRVGDNGEYLVINFWN